MIVLNWMQNNLSWILHNPHCDELELKAKTLLNEINAFEQAEQKDQEDYEKEKEEFEKARTAIEQLEKARKISEDALNRLEANRESNLKKLEDIKKVALVVFDTERVLRAVEDLSTTITQQSL